MTGRTLDEDRPRPAPISRRGNWRSSPPSADDLSSFNLSLAISPGVAAPCLAIHADPNAAYDTPPRATFGACVEWHRRLGLGRSARCVHFVCVGMEGKAVLFKRFAYLFRSRSYPWIDLIDDVDDFVNCVASSPSLSFVHQPGGQSSARLFVIEQRLREPDGHPVLFHDDQQAGRSFVAGRG